MTVLLIQGLEGDKLCLNCLLAVTSEKMFACHVFPDKNQKPLRMCRMRITKPIFSLISGNVLLNLDLDY